MRRLGELERTVMESLWSMAGTGPEDAFTVRQVAATTPDHAYTTILTVLDRLTRKGLVERLRDGKSHHYRPTGTRASYVAELMSDALAGTPDRQAALVHFAQSVPAEEAAWLRQALAGGERPDRRPGSPRRSRRARRDRPDPPDPPGLRPPGDQQ